MKSWLIAALSACLLAGCSSTPGYYWQAMSGQLEMWRKTRPIDEVLAEPATPETLRQRLLRVKEMRAFASSALGLPENGSYRGYADLVRSAAVWNVVAAPALSLQAKQWCFPVAGCVGYKGFFDEAEARALASELAAQGLDVYVGAVPAYSTLGWFDDPVLNTFVNWSDAELARLIFHELAHQLIYAKGDTEFNESFASTVELVGVQRWLEHENKPAEWASFERRRAVQASFAALTLKYQGVLMRLYAECPGGVMGNEVRNEACDEVRMKLRKQEAFEAMRAEYRSLRTAQPAFAGYEKWFETVNNAQLASVGFYNAQVPAFQALLKQEQGDLPRWFARVRALAELPMAERRKALELAVK